MEQEYSFGGFVHEPVPAVSFHRLGGLVHMFVSGANFSGQSLYWTVDKSRDIFILPMTPSGEETAEGDGLPVPFFLLGYRDSTLTVEFLQYQEKQEPEDGRVLYSISYKKGLLRLPETLRPEAEVMLGLVHDAIQAYRETFLQRVNHESGNKTTRVIEALQVEIDVVEYFSEHFS